METDSSGRLTRQEQARQTKRRLFDAAYSLLKEKDFKDITISDIVMRAGVSTGAFYLYYTSKLDVYYQTYVLADAYFLDAVAPRLQTGNTRSRLLTYFDEYAHYNSDFTSIRLTKLLYNGDNGCFLRTDEGMHSVLMDVVRYGLSAGELDDALSTDELCVFLMNMARGLVYDWCIRDGAYDLKQAMRRDMTRLYRAVSKCLSD